MQWFILLRFGLDLQYEIVKEKAASTYVGPVSNHVVKPLISVLQR